MKQMRYRLASGVLTGCLALLGGCATDGGPQSSEQTSTAESSVLVQDCPPSYGSCTNWSAPEPVNSPYCSYGNGACGQSCEPLPGRPFHCDFQIIPTAECCNFVPTTEQFTTMQSHRICFDISANSCVEIDQTPSLTGCGCT
jgi:hypothetical protein